MSRLAPGVRPTYWLVEIETTKGGTPKNEKIEKYIKADNIKVVEKLTDKYDYFR